MALETDCPPLQVWTVLCLGSRIVTLNVGYDSLNALWAGWEIPHSNLRVIAVRVRSGSGSDKRQLVRRGEHSGWRRDDNAPLFANLAAVQSLLDMNSTCALAGLKLPHRLRYSD